MRDVIGVVGAALGVAVRSAFDNSLGTYDPANPNTRLAKLPHIDTPKPTSKRRKRRLRGRAKGVQA